MNQYVGEIRMMAFGNPPKGWLQCNGQLLPINQNQALFALLGNTYGGDGRTTFALPNLQGATPLHPGNGITQGASGGEASHALAQTEMPAHTHTLSVNSGAAIQGPNGIEPAPNSVVANAAAATNPVTSVSIYSAQGGVAFGGNAVATSGGGQPHLNQQPFTVLNFCIATVGIFPSRN